MVLLFLAGGLSMLHNKKSQYALKKYENLVNNIIKQKPKMVMLDIPSPDKYPYNTHKQLLKNDILIVENVINMRQLFGKKFNVCKLMKFDRCSAASAFQRLLP